MRKEMGNQNTSGIVVEERAANEAPKEAQEENQVLTQEETNDFHEKSADIDSLDHASQSDKLSFNEKEQVNGTVNEEKTDLPCVSSNHEEPKKLNSEGGLSKSASEVHNQESNLNGETPKIDWNSEPNSSSLPHEAVDSNSETQQEQNMLTKEIEETPQSSNIGQIEEESELVETEEEQTLGLSLILDNDNQDDVKNNEDDLVVTDMNSDEATFPETNKHNENSVVETTGDNNEKGVGIERNVDPFNDEIDSCFKPSNQFISISSLDSTEARNEPLNESLVLAVVPELGNQTQLPDQAMNHQLATESDLNKYNKQPVARINQLSRNNSIKSIPIEEELKDSNKANGRINEIGLVQTETNQEADDAQKIRNDCENDHAISSITSEAEIQNCEAYIPQVIKYKGNENGERLSVEVELRKSPSFEFGLLFDAMSEDSDKTPLLYQDRTAIRRYSSCSNLRFMNANNVQNEYYSGKSLLQCEEKTIRMERSNSENLMKKEENTINVVMNTAKEENSFSSDKKQSKGNGKKKVRSSLFTTCICCSAEVIS